jgi:integrase
MRQMMAWAKRTRPYKRLLVDSDFFEVDVNDVVTGDYGPVRSNERTRTLADGEIVSLARHRRASTLPVYVLHAVFIMLGTGCRVGELSMARWLNVDLDAGIWTLPALDTKTQVEIRIVLSPFVLRQFQAQLALNPGEYVLPVRPEMAADAEEPISNQQIGKLIAYRQRTRAENREKPIVMDHDSLVLAGGRWRCHDLRRTAATIMQRCGVDDTTAHRCLNHAREDALDRVYLQELLTPLACGRRGWRLVPTSTGCSVARSR